MFFLRREVHALLFLLLVFGLGTLWAEQASPHGNTPRREIDGFVYIPGGDFKSPDTNFFGRHVVLNGFYIGKCEVSQKEWQDVMGANPSHSKGDALPVEMVSWYDCIEYCNKRSEKEGLTPYYLIDKQTPDPNNLKDPHFENDFDTEKWTVTPVKGANGYRLPTEAEWEYAASGAANSQGFIYSGSNNADEVAWFYQNSGDIKIPPKWHRHILDGNHDRSHPVGTKAANELGLYDMSGNVREWCWDWYGELSDIDGKTDPCGSPKGSFRVWKGGCWMSSDFCCVIAFRGNNNPSNYRSNDQGLRVCRGE